ncbi:MAG TPA: anti-sigma factor [Terriglobales bacterium]|nr:anti-sigma factor [Terriglobales bacterium]
MNCELAETTIHGYFDGELDAVRSAEFERHLEHCPQCQAALEGIDSLRTQLQQSDLYEHASPELREKVRKQIAQETRNAPFTPGRSWKRWFLMPTFGTLAAAAALITIMIFVIPSHREATLTSELIDAHVRSLQPGHLFDVQSTDQHTVKPWFDGKLDFIPPVSDYAAQGFPLVGGRLDVIDGHNVAALVYARRKHFINVFVWPEREKKTVPDTSGSREGYNWVAGQFGDMQVYLISDVAPSDLHELKSLIHR